MTRRIIPACVLMVILMSMLFSACSSPKPPPTITVTATFPPPPGSPTPLVTGITPPPSLPSPTPIPTRTLAPLPTLPPTPAAGAILGYHTVQSGETLYCIGRAYQVNPAAIARQNNLVGDVLSVGQKLAIPNVPWSPVPAGRTCQRQF